MAIKKATFKHFDKSRLNSIKFELYNVDTIFASKEIKTIEVPKYFRLTCNRKSTTLKSIFLESAFEFVEYYQTSEPNSKIPSEWEGLKQQIVDLDCEILDLFLSEFFIEPDYNLIKEFKSFYYSYSKSFINELDRDITREIYDSCIKLGSPNLGMVIQTCLAYNYKNSDRDQVMVLKTHLLISNMLNDVNTELLDKIITDNIRLKIKLFEVLIEQNNIATSDGSFSLSYFPFIYIKSAKWRPKLLLILNENFKKDEIDKVSKILESDLAHPKFYGAEPLNKLKDMFL